MSVFLYVVYLESQTWASKMWVVSVVSVLGWPLKSPLLRAEWIWFRVDTDK